MERNPYLRPRSQRSEIAGTHPLSHFLEHSAVLDDRGADVYRRARVVGVFKSPAGTDAELSGAKDGENVRCPAPGKTHGGEVVQDFKDGAPWAARVVEELVGVGGVGEFEEAVAVHRVGGEFREDFEEEAAGYGCYVEVVEEEGAEGRRVGVVDAV